MPKSACRFYTPPTGPGRVQGNLRIQGDMPDSGFRVQTPDNWVLGCVAIVIAIQVLDEPKP